MKLKLFFQVSDRMLEMTELKEKVENAKAQLHLSTQEYSTLKTQLDITREILDIMAVLSNIHTNLKEARGLLKSRHLCRAAQSLAKTEKLLQVTAAEKYVGTSILMNETKGFSTDFYSNEFRERKNKTSKESQLWKKKLRGDSNSVFKHQIFIAFGRSLWKIVKRSKCWGH